MCCMGRFSVRVLTFTSMCPSSSEIVWRSEGEYSTDERGTLEVFVLKIVFNSRHMVDRNVSEEDIREGGAPWAHVS